MTNINYENTIAIILNTDNSYTPDQIDNAYTSLYSALKKNNLSYVAYNYCRGEYSLAEDAFQSSVIKLFSFIKEGKIENYAGLNKWIRTSCRYYVMSWFRSLGGSKKKKESSEEENEQVKPVEVVCFSQLDAEDDGSYFEYLENVADESHLYFDPARYSYSNEALNQVHNVIKNAIMNPEQRKVFKMCVLEDKKMQEVADELNMNINTVKSNLRYARKAIEMYRKKYNYDPYAYVYGQEKAAD